MVNLTENMLIQHSNLMVMLTFPGYYSTGLVQMPVSLLDDHFNQKFHSLNIPMEVELTHLNFLCSLTEYLHKTLREDLEMACV